MMKYFEKQCYKILSVLLVCSFTILCQQENSSVIYPSNSSQVIPALNFKDTDIRDILRSIAYEYQTNIVVENQINQKVSVTLFNVKVSDAIKMISEDNNLSFSFDQQRFFV
ncbi:MAG: hypothetical protein R6W90_06065, partial [Ignavibacteriaceae bacterium]